MTVIHSDNMWSNGAAHWRCSAHLWCLCLRCLSLVVKLVGEPIDLLSLRSKTADNRLILA